MEDGILQVKILEHAISFYLNQMLSKLKNHITLVILLFVILIPRIARLLYGFAQFEDINYLYGPFLIISGQVPYQDFAVPNLVGLEFLLAGFYLLIDVSYVTAEYLSIIAISLTVLYLFRIGSVVFSVRAGIITAFLYSTHYLVFRYHMFEREIYTNLALAGMLLIILTRKERDWRMYFYAALVLGVGFSFKQTMLLHGLSLGIVLLLQRDWRGAGWFALFSTLTLSTLVGAHLLLFGEDFWQQAVLYHFLKGSTANRFFRIFGFLSETTYLLPMGLFGLLLGGLYLFNHHFDKTNRDSSEPAKKTLFLFIVIEIVVFLYFVVYASQAFWPHYMLGILVQLSLAAGFYGEQWLIAVRRLGCFTSRKWLRYTVLMSPFLIVIHCYSGLGWPHLPFPESIGFGGKSRYLFEVAARVLESKTATFDTIIAPPDLALEANRVKLVNFKDNWGNMMWLKEQLKHKELNNIRKIVRQMSFADLMLLGYDYWVPQALRMIQRQEVKAVAISETPPYDFPSETSILVDAGYYLAYRTQDFSIYLRHDKE